MENAIVKRFKPLPSNSKLLIFGGGFSGQHIASLARELGTIVLCSRQNNQKDRCDFVFNSNTKEIPNQNILDGVTHVISCIPPDSNGRDPVLAHLKEQLEKIKPKWVGYLSTTGVYGDSKGEWVTEKKRPDPQQVRSIRRLACEKEWENRCWRNKNPTKTK